MKLFGKNEILSWFGVSAIALLPTLVACLFTFPQADDFGYAELALNHDWKTEFVRLYSEWSGRYSSIIFGFLSPLSFGNTAIYGSIIFLGTFLFIVSSLLFFIRITKSFGSSLFGIISGLLFTAVFFNLMPSPGETIYWYSGMITYLLPCSFLMISLYFLIHFLQKNNWFSFIIGCVFLIITLGGNEVLSLNILIISTLILVLTKRSNSKYYRPISWIYILVLIGNGVLFSANGNFVRQELFTAEGSIMEYLIMSDIQLFRFLFLWLSNLSIWILFLISLVFGHYARVKNFQAPLLLKLNPVFLYILPLIIIYSSILPAYLIMGMLGQHRTIVPAFFLFLLWFIILGFRIGYISNFMAHLFPYVIKYTKVILMMFLGVIFFSGNNSVVLNDLFQNKFEDYFIQSIERNQEIDRALQTDQKAVFKPYSNYPDSYHDFDIKSDSSHWMNMNISRYYGIESVKLKDEN